MPFDWREYLALAQFVQTQTGVDFGEEAAQRCAVSRAYYAAFCMARNHAQVQTGFVPSRKAEDHRALADHLRKHGHTSEAVRLDRLRQWRNQCDYNDNVTNLSQLVDLALKQANDIIDRI